MKSTQNGHLGREFTELGDDPFLIEQCPQDTAFLILSLKDFNRPLATGFCDGVADDRELSGQGRSAWIDDWLALRRVAEIKQRFYYFDDPFDGNVVIGFRTQPDLTMQPNQPSGKIDQRPTRIPGRKRT